MRSFGEKLIMRFQIFPCCRHTNYVIENDEQEKIYHLQVLSEEQESNFDLL